MKALCVAALLLTSAAGYGAGFSVNWQHPTHNVDGSRIGEAGEHAIQGTRVEWGGCRPDGSFDDQAVEEHFVEGLGTTLRIDGLTADQTYCVRAFTRNHAGEESSTSNVISRVAF